MSNIFDLYKPFRNKVRAYNLRLCFEDLWAYSQHLLGDLPMRDQFVGGKFVRVRDSVYPWNLSILARELVLHGSERGERRLDTWANLANLVNGLRDVESGIAEAQCEPGNVLATLHSIAHQQFPWQGGGDRLSLIRYLKIFGQADVERCLLENTGLTVRDFYFMGIAVAGHLQKNFGINSDQRYTDFDITLDKSTTFFSRLSIDIDTLREKTREEQKYDDSWEYTWNPLEATPLVRLDKQRPNLLHCPIPELLLRRISHGVFYDLINVVDFDNAYGRAYERYVGDVLKATFTAGQHCLLDEQEYRVGKNIKHGVDWILTDGSATLFVECKTKRLVRAAKIATAEEPIRRDIGILADAVVQLYKNLADALDGKASWTPDGKPVFPIVLTLEDWYLFSPMVLDMLHSNVVEGVQQAGLSADMVDRLPYTIASIRELEHTAPVIAEVGINPFFSVKTSSEHARWNVEAVAQDKFPEAWRRRNIGLFREDWVRFFPELDDARG